MPRKRKPLPWTEEQVQALHLVFEGRKSQATIAESCGVPLRTLEDWIAHPDFHAALADLRANLIASLDNLPYIRKERRLIGLAQMAEAARVEFEARPWLVERRQVGRDGEGKPLYLENESFNRDAHQAFREACTDIAKELGERTNNVRIAGAIEHSILPQGDLKALADELLGAVRDIPEARAALAAQLLLPGTNGGE